MHHQHRVLGAPRLRRGAQQDVLPGPHAQRIEAAVDAAGVRLEHRALRRCGVGDDAARHLPEAEQPRLAVLRGHALAQQGRELARREAARQVHLEEAVLRVQEAETVGDIGFARPAYGRRTAVVALQRHRSDRPALDRREAAIELRR